MSSIISVIYDQKRRVKVMKSAFRALRVANFLFEYDRYLNVPDS